MSQRKVTTPSKDAQMKEAKEHSLQQYVDTNGHFSLVRQVHSRVELSARMLIIRALTGISGWPTWSLS